MAKKSFRKNIVTNSMYSLISGVGLEALMPMLTTGGRTEIFIMYLLKMFGVLGIAYYAWTWSKFDKLFENLGLGMDGAYPIFKSKSKTDYSEIYKFTLPRGLSLEDFDEHKDAIEQFLGRKIAIKYTYKEICIEIFDKNQKTFYEYMPTKIKGDVPIMIGYDYKGELIGCDLSSGEPHMGVYGETGSGKSTVMRAIITNLILMSEVKLHLVDLKNGAEFNLFRRSNKVVNFCRSIKETEILLNELSIEVDRRYDLFYEKDVKDIKEYNKKFKSKKLDYQMLIIDEFADLKTKTKCMDIIKEIARKSRACGIHIIIATQRPSATVLDGDVKANITSILGLKTVNSINSQVAMDETGLEKLRGMGNGIFKRSGKVEIQAPFLEPDTVRELIKYTFVEKKVDIEKGLEKVITEEDLLKAVSELG